MRILIVGTGSIGRRHIEVVKADGEHHIVICDINKNSVKETAEQFQIRDYFCDYEEALEKAIDAVIICTPNAYHADACIKALEKGCNVLVEKPIAHKSEDGERMVNAVEKYGKVLMVGYILRVYPGMDDIKRIIDEGQVGRPVSARVSISAENTLVFGRSDYRKLYETGGGIIYDYSHEIDYLRYFFGEPQRFACFKGLMVRKHVSCDDIAEMIIQFKSNVIASVHMDYIQECGKNRNRRSIDIICEKGIINYDFNGRLHIQENNGTIKQTIYTIDRNKMFLKQFKIFIDACRGKDVDYVKGEDGLAVLKICEELYKSDRENIVIHV